MSDEDKWHSDLGRAKRAQLLMDDELLQEAFSSLEDHYTKLWRESVFKDADGRERCFYLIAALNQVKGHLQQVLDGGKNAVQNIEWLAKVRRK